MQKISIIIPIYNAERTIKHCLDCLINQNYDPDKYEIILIDDGSSDKTPQIIKKYLDKHPTISYIKLTKNSGPSTARNTGADKAKYDILAFIDSDAYADKNWLINISNAFTQDKVLACGGMIDNYNNGFFSNINHISEFSEFYSTHKKQIRTLPSANLIYDKKIFNQIGGFNQDLRSGEDTDLNMRFTKTGNKLYYYPNIIVKHDTSDNFILFTKKIYKYGEGSFIYRNKHPLVKNKLLLAFGLSSYILYSTYLHIIRRSFYKHPIKSILGIPFLLILRGVFWLGVFNYRFFIKKQTINAKN